MDAIVSHRLKELVGYWVGLADGSNGRPSRTALDPSAIPHLLPQILLIDVHYEPLRFQHRLVGTQVAESVGRDTTGQAVDGKLYRETAGSIFDSYAEVVKQRRPLHANGKVQFADAHNLDAEVVLLPLFESDTLRFIVAGLELAGMAMTAAGEPRQSKPFEIHTDGPRPLRLRALPSAQRN